MEAEIEPEQKDEVDQLGLVEGGEKLGEEEVTDDKVEQKKEMEKVIDDYELNIPDAKEDYNEVDKKEKETSKEVRKSVKREKHKCSKEETTKNREVIIERMKQQNTRLKKEFSQLKAKLEECIEKAKQGYRSMNERPPATEDDISKCSCN